MSYTIELQSCNCSRARRRPSAKPQEQQYHQLQKPPIVASNMRKQKNIAPVVEVRNKQTCDFDGSDHPQPPHRLRATSDASDTCSCHALPGRDITTTTRVTAVCNLLTQLTLDEQPHATNYASDARQLSHEAHANKVTNILRLYLNLINLTPPALDAHLDRSELRLLDARQQVLRYIESLHGYCDSINSLRLILKSHSMTGAMSAYECVVQRIHSTRQLSLDYAPAYNFLCDNEESI